MDEKKNDSKTTDNNSNKYLHDWANIKITQWMRVLISVFMWESRYLARQWKHIDLYHYLFFS